MAKPTKSQAKQMAEELLSIRDVADRYKYLEGKLKEVMVGLEMKEIQVKGKGHVFISQSQTTTIAPELARDVLGVLANKVIEVKESVSNQLVSALVKTGDIKPDEYKQLQDGAKKTPKVSLYVRPLK